MRHVVSATLVIVAIIHLLPLAGVLGAARLATLYGVSIADPELLVLMRHRAVLLGVVGALLLIAALRRQLQATAFAVGFASVISFLLLTWPFAEHNAQVARVIVADVVALGCLVIGAVVAFLRARHQRRLP